MSANKKIVLYHSVICPRCQLSGIALRKVLKNYPGVEVEKIEYLTNLQHAKQSGVNSIPTLVADGRSLSGIVLTRQAIEEFVASVDNTET